MSSYAERLAVDIRTAYEGRDREALESTLKRMVSAITYTGPVETSSCSRKLLGCECTSQEQRSHCMFRSVG